MSGALAKRELLFLFLAAFLWAAARLCRPDGHILMSLPAEASWRYDHRPEPGSPEAATLALLRKGIDWV